MDGLVIVGMLRWCEYGCDGYASACVGRQESESGLRSLVGSPSVPDMLNHYQSGSH